MLGLAVVKAALAEGRQNFVGERGGRMVEESYRVEVEIEGRLLECQ